MEQIAEIDRYLKRTKLKPSYFGKITCGNARAVARIRSGTASLMTLSKVMAYIKEHPANERRIKQLMKIG